MFEYFGSSVAFATLPFAGACRALADCGFDEVDIWSTSNWCEHLPPDQPALDIAAVQAMLTANRLHCQAISVYGNPWDICAARLEQLAALGGTALVRGAERGIDVATFAERLRPVADRARDLGVTLAIENHLDTCIDTTASMIELVERIDHPGLGIALAPIHIYRLNEDVAAAIRALGNRIALFYAWDWGPTAETNWKDPHEQIPGRGKIDFPPIFRALHDIGYPRKLCLFAHGLEHQPVLEAQKMIREGVRFCQECDRSANGSYDART